VNLSRRQAIQAALAFTFAPRGVADDAVQAALPPPATSVWFDRDILGECVVAYAQRGSWNMAAQLQPGQTEDDLRAMLLEAINDDAALVRAMGRSKGQA
jgi:hypothetical protein